MIDQKPLSANDVAELCGCAISTVQKFAQKKGLEMINGGYVFYQKDIEDFSCREKPGRRWLNKK